MKSKTSFRSFLALFGSSLLVASSVNATQFWDGTGLDANWNTPENWGGDVIPAWTTAIQFGGTNAGGTAVGTTPAAQTSAVNDLAAGTNIKGILLTNNGTTDRTQAFTLSGNSILLGTGTNDSITTTAISGANPAIEDVIALNIDFGTAAANHHNRVFNTGTSHDLKIDGVLSGSGSSTGSPWAYVMMKQGLGKLTLTNANNYYPGYTNITGPAGTTPLGNSVLEITSIANGGVNSSIGASSNVAANLRFSYAVNGVTTNTLRYVGSADGSTDRSIYLAGNTGTSATNSAVESSGAGTLSFTRSAAIEFSNPGVPRNLYLGGTNTGDNVINLSLSNNGAGVSSLTKQGDGKWILTNANTYTGATTIAGGKLTLGVTDCLANTSNVVIGTGTLEVGAGFTDTVGTLDCTGAATINLGDSSSQLVFADSYGVDWTDTDPDGTLNITGTFVSGASLKFGDGTPGTGLNASQLAAITINSVPGSYSLDGSGFLVAGGGTPYSIWAGGAVFTDDANGDGVKDGLAWILGASGPGVSALDKLPVVANPTGFLTLDFDRVNPYSPAKLYVEFGNDLVGWTVYEIPAGDNPDIGGGVEVDVTSGTPDSVLVKIPTSHAVGGKLFARLRATEN